MAKQKTTSIDSISILIPELSALSIEDKKRIDSSQIKRVFVLSNEKGAEVNENYVDLSGKSSNQAIEELQDIPDGNIIHLGQTDLLKHAIEVAKKKSDRISLIGKKKTKGKQQKKGVIGRALYEFNTQLLTKVNKRGSHTKTAIYSKKTLLWLIKNGDKSLFQNFNKLIYRAVEKGQSLNTVGDYSSLPVKGNLKQFGQNIVLFFTEKWRSFIKEPLKEFKTNGLRTTDSVALYKFLLMMLIALSFVILPILSFNYGATWDEKLHIDYGREVINEFPDGWMDNTIYEKDIHAIDGMKPYSASFDVVCAFISDAFPSIDIYDLRHFFNTFFGIFLFIFVALIAKEFGGWRAALIAYLLILFSPSIFGHIFNNPKDIPFATGYAMGVLFLIRLFKELPNPSLKTSTLLVASIALSISIRPPGIILIAFCAMVMGLHWLLNVPKKSKKKTFIPYLKQFVIVSLLGYMLGILIWPFGIQDPINNPLEALKQLSNFSLLTAYQIFEGSRQYIKPWYYGPYLILITAPLLVLLGFALSIFGILKLKANKRILLLFLFFVFAFPIVYSIYKESYLYNGWRHFLFVYGPFAALSGIGLNLIFESFKQKYVHIALWAIVAFFTIKVAYWQIKNHPFEYVYFNELVGGTSGAAGEYETDYWCQTSKAGLDWLANNVDISSSKIRVKTNNEHRSLQHYASNYSDSIQIIWSREYEWLKGDWDYAIWTTRTLSKSQIQGDYWPPKGTIHTIDVDGFPLAAVVKREQQHAKLGIEYLEKKQFQKAIEELKLAEKYNPLEEEVVRRIGLAYKGLNQFDEALPYLKKALELRDGNYEALFALGEINMYKAEFLSQQGKTQEAANLAAEAKDLFAKTIGYKINYTSAYYYLGNIYLNEGNYSEAIKQYDALIQRRPDIPQAYYMKARALLALNDVKSAIETLGYAIGANKNFKEAYVLLAECYKKQGNQNAANQVLQKMPK